MLNKNRKIDFMRLGFGLKMRGRRLEATLVLSDRCIYAPIGTYGCMNHVQWPCVKELSGEGQIYIQESKGIKKSLKGYKWIYAKQN